MFKKDKFPFVYSHQLNCKAIELGYKKSNTVMVVLLPNENNSVEQLKANLNVNSFDNLLSKLYSQKVNVSIPKFKLESTLQLIPVLAELGIKDIFDAKVANFSGITSDPLGLFVGDVIQKAVIEVNEEGTEASAATGITYVSRSSRFRGSIAQEFRADRPFMFFLLSKYKRNKNLILFSGIVNNPKL
jgi:serpin B